LKKSIKRTASRIKKINRNKI